MKTNLDLIQQLITEYQIDVNMFYCITIRNSEIQLQGKYNINLASHFIMHGFTHNLDSAGFTHFKKDSLIITLA